MLLNRAADKLVFKFLSKIKNGYLEITTYEGEILKFGNPDQSLKANIKIKNPNFNFSPSWVVISRYPFLILLKNLKTNLSAVLFNNINSLL